MDLKLKKCVPCEGGLPTGKSLLPPEEIKRLLTELNPAWQHAREENIGQLERKFKFKNFTEAMKFVNTVAALAEEENHHPDIYIFYNVVRVVLWTHAVSGLSENDFILAAKIDTV